MLFGEEQLRPSGITVERLSSGDFSTFYAEKPSEIARLVQEKLNQITNTKRDIVTCVPIPDYHTVGADGGVKDILFVVRPGTSVAGIQWETTTLLESDEDTMHGVGTDEISQRLENIIQELEAQGNLVRYVIPITDSHSFRSMFSAGIGGLDGLKNLIICYHKK